MEKYVSFIGIFVMIGIAYLCSNKKQKIDWKLVVTGHALQLVFALLILKTEMGQAFFVSMNDFVVKLVQFSDQGAMMVFGNNFRDHFFAFSVLSTIVFVSAAMSVLFYLGIIQKVVEFMAWIMVKVMRVSGAESLAASANVFIGQTEAPLVVKPYITSMTKSELMAMMTGGMATIAGAVLVAFVGFGVSAGHLVAASIMSAPASLVYAKIIFPETETSKTLGKVKIDIPRVDRNALDAACRGASEGLNLAVNVIAMLIAFVALVALLNYGLSVFSYVGLPELTFEKILGWLMAPLAFVMGVPWDEAVQVGYLLGKKTVLNEFIAYMDLKEMKDTLSERSFVIATYALCGFANFSSIAIQIGGIGALVPERRKDLADLGVRALIGGTLASFCTACIAGMLI